MGQKQSSFSKFDDLVVDHNDVLARMKQVFGALSSKGASCTFPITESFSIPHPKAHPISGCSSCDSISFKLHCDAAQQVAATDAVQVQPPCSRDEPDNTIKAVRSELAVALAEAAAAVNCVSRNQVAAAAAAEEEAQQAAASSAAAMTPSTAANLKPAVVPHLPDLTRLSISSAAMTARDQLDDLFTSVDKAQQQQEQAAALDSLAAAAATATGASRGGRLSAQEKAVLREAGTQTRLRAAAELAAQVDATDAALKAMDEQDRKQWFEDHAKQQQTDELEMDFDEEWANLPPEVLAMVTEMQKR